MNKQVIINVLGIMCVVALLVTQITVRLHNLSHVHETTCNVTNCIVNNEPCQEYICYMVEKTLRHNSYWRTIRYIDSDKNICSINNVTCYYDDRNISKTLDIIQTFDISFMTWVFISPPIITITSIGLFLYLTAVIMLPILGKIL